MITMTPEAGSYLSAALSKVTQREHEGECFRLARSKEGQIALVPGKQTPEDVALVHENTTVLVVERDLAEDLQGHRVDIEENAQGSKSLVLTGQAPEPGT
jgi:hypothetical protein